MAYRSGTYIAFHANGTSEPTESDMKYYNLLKAWHVRDDRDFEFVDSHQKGNAVRDSSSKETLARALRDRLKNSKNMLLIMGETTKEDTDWVPFEIRYAVDECKIPLIIAYPGYEAIWGDPASVPALHNRWPTALQERVNNGTLRAIHIPFKHEPIAAAVEQFNFENLPPDSRSYYNKDEYINWGLATR